jgi:DNA-directed RNA polymerase subunit beta'
LEITNLDQIYQILKSNEPLKPKYAFVHKIKTKNKSINMPIGRIWFNLLLPDFIQLIDEPVDKSKLNKILRQIYDETKNLEETADIITNINKAAFKMSGIFPITFSIDSLIIPDEIKKKRDKLKEITDPVEFSRQQSLLGKELIQFWINNNIDFSSLSISKASKKASPEMLATILLARGAVSDLEGNVKPVTTNCVTDGFTLEELYDNSAEARRGAFIRAVGSAEPGVLSRDIVYANANIQLSEKEDCKTKKYLELIITENLANVLLDRYCVDELTGELKLFKDLKNFIGKKVKIRSPLYCKSLDGICSICYGGLANKLNTKNIGITAGVNINNVLVNSAMKARHDSSISSGSKVNLIKDRIV